MLEFGTHRIGKQLGFTNAQSCQSLRFSHTRSMEVEGGSDNMRPSPSGYISNGVWRRLLGCITCVKQPLSKKLKKMVLKTNYRLMQVKSIAECSKGSILQYFWPSLIYHLALRSLFCSFLSGRFTQVLLYAISTKFLFAGSYINPDSLLNNNICFYWIETKSGKA